MALDLFRTCSNAILLLREEYWTFLVVKFKFRTTLKLATPIFSLNPLTFYVGTSKWGRSDPLPLSHLALHDCGRLFTKSYLMA
jgi:hypothetical protein